MENVKGLLAGNAKAYAKEIVQRLRSHGYTVQVFLLNAATMGVPQMRERCFFIARLDASWPNLVLKFDEPPIPFGKVYQANDKHLPLSPSNTKRWHIAPVGLHPVASSGNNFGYLTRASHLKVAPTLLSGQTFLALQDEPKDASLGEYRSIGSYPNDYDFGDIPQKYLIGMSVPPIMTAQIANQINVQWFSNSVETA